MKHTYSQPIIAIVGPTAIGKTSISIDVAKRINGEIIGLDSRQIYKGMSIGTAQPSKKELKLIPHHLIGIKDPNFIISSGEYANLVVNAVSDIIERNKEPIICGGAGLYYRAISKGIFTGSKTDLNIRSLLNDQYEKLGAEKLFSKLEEIDPVYSKKVHLNNKKRLIRALEIYMTTGKSPSVHFDSQKKRTTSLLNLGWVEETKKLISNRKKLNFHPIDSIGYKQIISFLNGDISESELENEIIVKTTQYAKNQIKWFRKEKIDLEINLDMESNSIVKKIIETFFNVKSSFIKN